VTFTRVRRTKHATGGCMAITQQLLITISSHSSQFELRRRSIVYAASRDEDPLPGLKLQIYCHSQVLNSIQSSQTIFHVYLQNIHNRRKRHKVLNANTTYSTKTPSNQLFLFNVQIDVQTYGQIDG